mmetsp:Transcript_46471/g.145401  ORF Transcript_46471/g.145401 Transcript_46471/m.145401 type:complete len:247 (-) Transcript_46471:333-1073(-)
MALSLLREASTREPMRLTILPSAPFRREPRHGMASRGLKRRRSGGEAGGPAPADAAAGSRTSTYDAAGPRMGRGAPASADRSPLNRPQHSLTSVWSALYRAAWVFALDLRLQSAQAKHQALVEEQARSGYDGRAADRTIRWLVHEISYLRRTNMIANREAAYFGVQPAAVIGGPAPLPHHPPHPVAATHHCDPGLRDFAAYEPAAYEPAGYEPEDPQWIAPPHLGHHHHYHHHHHHPPPPPPPGSY